MMMIPVYVSVSQVHGCGVFAVKPITKGTVVWAYEPSIDRTMSAFAIEYVHPRVRDFVRERGYVNPARAENWVVCADEAQFLNFPLEGETANLHLGGIIDGEHLLIASCDIDAGAELFVPPESDADYDRKMKER